ncbi:Macrolide export ATP-binding/permease protein macB [Fibrisoma limi BUZ 3]|uniref:Macrolide export ATP-binding/permease protein macB n=1 Tax=Fibrisoma limi BUZ 3 TaxID=1185876 RepID=I2GEU5_9BACT|nr:ABC transporter permease [Fibrisoma limi]CCH52420.1 Macrolide export ATP-binding/permease protein macB [Fibrisoma limi BUZ 3]
MNPNQPPPPPKWPDRLLNRLIAPHLREEVLGDIHERYALRVQRLGERAARRTYWREVLAYVRPRFIRREQPKHPQPTNTTMLRNYLKIALRNLAKNKAYSAINIGGLAVGMAVAMLIGLWIYDELSFNKYHQNYNRIARVMQSATFEGAFGAGSHMPLPLGNELRTNFADDFTYVVMASWNGEHILAYGDKKFTKQGSYLSPEAPDMFTLKMLRGTRAGLKDPASIMLSESVAQALFGNDNPLGKIVMIDNKLNVMVTGVYEDLPYNTEFRDMTFIAPWALYVSSEAWVKRAQDNMEWNNNSWQILAQIAPNATFDAVNAKIKGLRVKHVPETAPYKAEVFLQPMSRWHLFTGWDKQGNLEGRIQYVWLFGLIGLFVLLLACINFMNLSTARSEKRAKEVGIRKAVGSVRSQLISQFFSESLLVVACALTLSLLLVILALPLFNEVADKQVGILWDSPVFWVSVVGFSLFTGLIAGSYPAFYLSSFQPVKVLKGTFRAGRFASVPRKVLVVVQFTVSVTLIIGTILVFRQIQYAKNRPIGYDRNGLITVAMNTPELHNHYNALREELLRTGAVVDMSTSSTPATDLNSQNIGFDWEGKDPNFNAQFGTIAVTHDFGKTVGWQFKEGRDFSRAFSTDSAALVMNETAAKYMNLKTGSPVGMIVKWNGKPMRVLGVVKDMVMGSPFKPVYQTVFMLNYGWANVINIKLNPKESAPESLAKIETVFQKFNPGSPFDYKFTDQQYALKFAAEERIGKLASVFAILAVFISCLGIFGLASFVAEQRTKEIGVRKVLGATVFSLWGLLSKDFVVLVTIAFSIATPLAWYFLSNWLEKYEYRTDISWWIFAVTGAGAMGITLLTVSYQSIKAATLDPVKSLRSE